MRDTLAAYRECKVRTSGASRLALFIPFSVSFREGVLTYGD
jgi:hypothetical protein